MAGRKRRASTSSVETVDDTQIRWRHETSVVRSVPKDLSSDDWPVFELRDAIILNQDGQTIANALHAGHKGPFIVRGNLMIDDAAQRTNLIMRVRTPLPLEIRRCASYSIGEADDGRPLIWVSGQGGWYEIDPCDAYKPMYNKMCEATTMYYNMVDIYEEDPPKKSKKSKYNMMDELAQVFHKYSSRVGDGATLEEVIERANEHAAFFIDQFSHNEGLVKSWQSTAFYKWVNTEHVELGKQIKDAIEKLRLQPYASDTEHSARENPRSRSVKSSSLEITDGRAFRASQRPKPAAVAKPVAAAKPVIAAPKVVPPVEDGTQDWPHYVRSTGGNGSDSAFESVLVAVEAAYDEMAPKKKGMHYTGTLSWLYFNYSFPTYKDGRVGSYKQPCEDVLHYYSKALIETLDPKYQGHGIYDELQKMASTPFKPLAYKPSDFPVTIIPRRSQPRKGTVVPQPSTPVPNMEDNTSGRSTPKPQGKRPTRTPGKSSLRPVSRAPKKRPRDEFESDVDSESPGMKRSHSHYFDEDDSMDDAPDLDVDSQDENDADDDIAGRQAKSKFDVEPIKLVIRAEKLPDSSPRGPHDTWTCDQDGCEYIVRGGDSEECQDRIRQHFRDHESKLTRMNLALSESARGHMPIKYAYFPPFLILVSFHPPPRPQIYPVPPLPLPTPTSRASSPLFFPPITRPTSPDVHGDSGIPDLSGSAKRNFQTLVEQFRKIPTPSSSSKKNGHLTPWQSFTRQNQTDAGGGGSAADKEEVDSVTVFEDPT